MNFVVDVGNSRIKTAWCVNAELCTTPVVSEHNSITHDFEGQHLKSLEHNSPKRVLVSSVAKKKLTDDLLRILRRKWDAPVTYLISPREGCGVTNAYQAAHRLGSDRWAVLVAAHRLYSTPSCIIDCGTAITIDALDVKGLHRGGVIFPGLSLMRSSLAMKTGEIGSINAAMVANDVEFLATQTSDAVINGTLFAAVGAIEKVVAKLELVLDGSMKHLITGGDAPILLPLLKGDYNMDPNLVLRGLAVIVDDIE